MRKLFALAVLVVCTLVQVHAQCVATISYVTNSKNRTVKFSTSYSDSLEQAQYLWDFGDRVTDDSSKVSHTYTQPTDTFLVCVHIIDSIKMCTIDTCIQLIFNEPCQITPDFKVETNDTLHRVKFTPYKIFNNVIVLWDFGDFQFSREDTIEHSYSKANDTYNACLYYVDTIQQCTTSFCKNITFKGCMLDTPSFDYYTDTTNRTIHTQVILPVQGQEYIWLFKSVFRDTGYSSSYTFGYREDSVNVCLYTEDSIGYCKSTTICKTIYRDRFIIESPVDYPQQYKATIYASKNADKWYLHVDGAENNNFVLKIYDALGREVFGNNVKANDQVPLDIQHVKSGIYIFSLYQYGQLVSMGKFVKI